MNELINGVVANLKDTQMFRRCGELPPSGKATVKSWEEATRHALTSKWENTKFDAQRALKEKLFLKSRENPSALTKERLQSWNAIVDYAKKECVPMLIDKVVLPSILAVGFAL